MPICEDLGISHRQRHPTDDIDLSSPGDILWELIPAGAPRRIAMAALEAFSEVGYHATSTRDIARRVGMGPGAIYLHYSSKAELLFVISRAGHESVLAQVEAAAGEVSDPNERVHRWFSAFAKWHAENHKLARVGQYEVHSLGPEYFPVIRDLRRKIEDGAHAVVQDALGRTNEEINTTTIAALSMAIDISRWYRSDGTITPETLGKHYGTLALRMFEIHPRT